MERTFYIGDLVELMNAKNKKNGIITWRSPTLHTYEGNPLGGFYDITMRYGGIQYDDGYKACFLYRVYWPDGTETVELGDDLIPIT